MQLPKLVILISGKRKCGKDFYSNVLTEKYPGCKVITMAKPVKRVFAEKYNLDYDLMCTDSNYKEKYRKEMIKWVIDNTKVDVDYLAKLTLQQYDKYSPILIVSDVRRVTDADYFKVFFKETICKLIRITANLDARKLRGFKFVPGIDDCPSECNMDAYEYDYLIDTSTNSTLEKTKNDFEPYIDALFK